MLLSKVKIDQVLGYFAAGVTPRVSSILDMSGYDGVLFVAGLGTLLENGTLDVFVEQNTVNSASGMARLATTTLYTVTAADALLTQAAIAVDVFRPQERYLQCTVDPTTQNAVILGVVALRYNSRARPVSLTGLLKSTQLVGPAEA